MSLRFSGGELLQRGRGVGGLLRFVKSLFSPFIRSAGKTIAKAATSTTAKNIGNSVKDQLIESGLKIGSDVLRGEDMKKSLNNEFQHIKRKAADAIDDQATKMITKKRKINKKQHKVKNKFNVKKKGDIFG